MVNSCHLAFETKIIDTVASKQVFTVTICRYYIINVELEAPIVDSIVMCVPKTIILRFRL